MIPGLSAHNLLQCALQMLIVACLGAALPVAFRIRHPRTQLWWCQLVLAACLALPLVEPRQHAVIVVPPNAAPAIVRSFTPPPTGWRAPRGLNWAGAVTWLLLAGALVRLCWLGVGLWHIRRYRIAARPFYPPPDSVRRAQTLTGCDALVCISREFQSPVTFGLWRPVVLLPESFLTLEDEAQVAIASHELLHVRRKDWAVSLVEEAVATLFWFHPGVWWLLSQIRLTREQLVDSEVVRLTGGSEPYIRALMTIAGMRMRLDLAPAPLFLRRRHLTLRMHSLLKEVSMSKLRLSVSYASISVILALSAWTALVSFPLAGQPQIKQAVVPERPGITVDPGGSILHRPAVEYSAEARQQKVEGTVVLSLHVNASGEVDDARAVSGPDALRRTALQSALQWHYAPDGSGGRTIRASVDFQLPAADPNGPDPALLQQIQNSKDSDAKLNKIDVSQLPEPLRSTIWEQVKGFQGQGLSNYLMNQIRSVVSSGETHVRYSWRCASGNQDCSLTFLLASAPQMVPPGPNVHKAYPFPVDKTPRAIVGSAVMESKLINRVAPLNPSGASGTVSLWILLGPDGHVTQVHVDDGPEALQQAAVDAVQQWTYKPTTAGGVALEVETRVTVTFGGQ